MCKSMTGRPINLGDKVVSLQNGNVIAGVVVSSYETCVIVQPLRPQDQWSLNSGETVHLDEVTPKLTPPPPPVDNANVAAGCEEFAAAPAPVEQAGQAS